MCALSISKNRSGRVVFYFIETVKARNVKKNGAIMRSENSPDNMGSRFNKEVDDQLLNSGEFLYQVIENADCVPYQLIFGKRVGEGYFLNVGDGLKQLLGLTSGEFTEQLFQEMIEEIIPLCEDIPKDRAESREKFINRGIAKYKVEILVTITGGEKKWIRDSSVPVVDDKTGKVIGSFGIFFDISENKQTIQNLKKASERADESDRLKSAFMNNLSHEIRTPLNAIVGFSTLLGEPAHIMEERYEYMDIITHSSDHLLEIVDDIVEISKIQAKIVRLIIKETNLNQMLQRVYDRFKLQASEKNIFLSFETHLDKGDIIIMTDGYKLFQSLINIVGNAVKFTQEGKVEFGYSLKEDKIEFYISDTGIGIKEEHQPNIFNTFYQAESSITQRYEGTGLGLSIAKAYIELLGGEIWFTSRYGEGSVFLFTVPFPERNSQLKPIDPA
jgi:signal transduction histidine kinase